MAIESVVDRFRGRLGSRPGPWLAGAAVLFVVLLATVLFVALTPRYALLFADLREPDLARMSEELRKKKTDFRIGADGRSLLVPEGEVHRVRMQLMAQDFALQGNVGFELFNGADLGMTEFVQKVNYQRALQGELARTIQAMDEVQAVRVHLAMPEQGLFKKTQARNKASVTLALKPGVTFTRAQTSGIQRMVAASVPDIAPGDVAVLDQRGVVLSATGPSDEALDDGWTERKRSTEAYLGKKASQVLDRMFGEGASLVSVDVQLNEERRSSTIEEVLPAYAPKDQAPAGIVTRERQSTRGAPAVEGDGVKGAGKTAESTSVELEYQVGKKVDHIQTPAGGVRRINVAVVLKAALSDSDALRVRELVSAAVGASSARGDTIAVTSLQRAAELVPTAEAPPALADGALAAPTAASTLARRAEEDGASVGAPAAWLVGGVLGVVALIGLARRRRPAPAAAALSADERQALLANVSSWLAGPHGQEERR